MEEYLGDGCFVSFDGWTYCLRAPREHGDHVVYLDHAMLAMLNNYAKRHSADEVAREAENGETCLKVENGKRRYGSSC